MKRFLISCGVLSVLLLALLSVSLFLLPDNAICNSMLGAQKLKLHYLGKVSGCRMVFVGGSNVGQGFDSGIVEKAFQRPVVNMGLHAGLGLIYQLEAIQGLVRGDDVVVVVPEYEMFAGSCWGSAELVGMITAIMPTHSSLLDAQQWVHLVEKMPRYACRKLMRLVTLFEPLRLPKGYDGNGVRTEPLLDHRLTFPSFKTRKDAAAYDDSVMSYINGFVAHCRQNGAEVVFLPPVFERTSFDHWQGLIAKIAKELKRNGTPFVAPPERFALDDALFEDTPYHLNAKGVPLRMERVVDALRPFVRQSIGTCPIDKRR